MQTAAETYAEKVLQPRIEQANLDIIDDAEQVVQELRKIGAEKNDAMTWISIRVYVEQIYQKILKRKIAQVLNEAGIELGIKDDTLIFQRANGSEVSINDLYRGKNVRFKKSKSGQEQFDIFSNTVFYTDLQNWILHLHEIGHAKEFWKYISTIAVILNLTDDQREDRRQKGFLFPWLKKKIQQLILKFEKRAWNIGSEVFQKLLEHLPELQDTGIEQIFEATQFYALATYQAAIDQEL